MEFYSTNNKKHRVGLKDAVIRGLAPDHGLYMPAVIPVLSKNFFDTLAQRSFQQIAFEVAKHLLGDDLQETSLRSVVDQSITFDAPLVEVEENVYALELFHGPTMAFKDFGARFMSHLLGYFAKKENRDIVILVATSGDTGSAVANGFLGVEGTRVVILYPSGKVSAIQEKQFTTLGKNITALEVDGTFDDCQRLVKQAFQDEELRKAFLLTSANSINIARLIPQSFYYFYAFGKSAGAGKPVVFSVPSGNFGNLTAGLLAKKMGLPIDHFVCATNMNDVFPQYLKTKIFQPRPSTATISNAMDVGDPSNFARLMDLYDHSFDAVKNAITGYSFSDSRTRDAMRQVYEDRGYIMDPHGAVGYLGLKEFLKAHPGPYTGIFLETAHPGKFASVVEAAVKRPIQLPPILSAFMDRKKEAISASAHYPDFKALLKSIL